MDRIDGNFTADERVMTLIEFSKISVYQRNQR
jgi:hypothetical protein